MLCELNEQFRKHVQEKNYFSDGDGILVAVSGGLDSLVLLHLLRFDPKFSNLNIAIGHFDHRMRSESHHDVLWLRGLAQAWGIHCEIGEARHALSSENDARVARYEFLEDRRVSLGLKYVLTAHHGDDQAETVLFRMLRGTGVSGLNGILESRSPGIVRPLLPFRRNELDTYAKKNGIQALQDPTNSHSVFARNVLRNEIIPQIEKNVAHGARTALIRLSQIAKENQNAWDSVLQKIYSDLILKTYSDRIVLDREFFLSFNDEACAVILRGLCQQFGINPNEAVTRLAVQFARKSQSGGEIHLGNAISLSRSFERLFLGKNDSKRITESFEIEVPGVGKDKLTLGEKKWRASWSTKAILEGGFCEVFCLEELVFPLSVRGWNPGDRITYSYGSKKLKKIFSEKKMSIKRRFETPLVVDAKDRILWIPGISRTSLCIVGKGTGRFSLSISD